MSNKNPILFSFRRCPYAMRARIAIKLCKQTSKPMQTCIFFTFREKVPPGHQIMLKNKQTAAE